MVKLQYYLMNIWMYCTEQLATYVLLPRFIERLRLDLKAFITSNTFHKEPSTAEKDTQAPLSYNQLPHNFPT